MLQVEEIFPVLAAGSSALIDLESNGLRIQGTQKLRIVRHANIDHAHDVWLLWVRRVKWRVLNAVPIDFPDVKIFLDFFNLGWYYVVGYAPYKIVVAGWVLL